MPGNGSKLVRFLGFAVALTLFGGCSHDVESPKVKLDKLTPDIICNDQFPEGGLDVAVNGDGFTPMPFQVIEEPAKAELPTVLLKRGKELDGSPSDNKQILFPGKPGKPNSDKLGWTSEELMTLTFDSSNKPDPGLYSVTVTNPDDKHKATLPIGLAIIPPPSIESIVPTALCNGFEDQTFTVHGQTFVQIDDAMPTVSFEGGAEPYTFPADSVSDCTDVAGLAETVKICKTIVTTVPANSVPEGDYKVVVTNPPPASCSSTEDITVKVLAEGPVLFYSDPPVVYNGINTVNTLYLTAVFGDFTVTIAPNGDPATTTTLDASLVPNKTNRIRAVMPSGQAPGSYDITVIDETGCATTLPNGVVVTDQLTVSIDSVSPPFGYTSESTSIQIFRDTTGSVEFQATPRAFLNPVDQSTNPNAIQLESVTWVDANTLSAIVPKDTPVGVYDLVVVNPDGSVGLLPNAFTSLGVPPPVITDIVPQSIVDQTGQAMTIYGTGFSGATVSMRCENSLDATVANLTVNVASGTETCDANQSCSITATVNTAIPQGSVCVVRVTNADSSYGDFSAVGITNSSFNLSEPVAGQNLLQARRALGSAAVKATPSQRFVYAIAGDDGAGNTLSSVEFAPVDLFGNMSPFIANPESLAGARTFVATTQIGRYVFALGGSNGGTALNTAERAVVLSPEEIPHIEDLDLCLASGATPCFGATDVNAGLPQGGYSYRVAAIIDPTDPENLGGETLASDPIIMKLPNIQNRLIVVKVTWSAPVDSMGAPLSGIIGWRIYRTPVDGLPAKDEVLLAEINDPTIMEYVDYGTTQLGTKPPVPLGSTSAWQALPNLGVNREGLAAAAAPDPGDPTKWYVYGLLGRDGATAQDTYDYLPVTILANGHQTVAGAWTAGTEVSAQGRWQFGAWTVNSVISSDVNPGDTWIYLGAGMLANGTSQTGIVEAGLVSAGGELGAFADDPTAGDVVKDFSSIRVGYGVAAAADRLFAFGGLSAQVNQNAIAAEIINPAPGLANNAWNNEGLQMTVPRYLMGSSIQSAFIFLLGGTSGTGALSSTETVVW